MPLKGNDTPADCPRNELDEEEETVQYSQVHHSGTANGEDADDDEFGSVEENGDEDAGRPPTKRRRPPRQLFIYPRSITQESWKRREGVVRRSCISFIIPWRSCASCGSVTQFMGELYDGRVAVPSISREGVV